MEMPIYEELFKQIKTNFWLIGIPYGNFRATWRYYVCFISLFLTIIAESAFLVSKITSVNLLEITQLAPCTGIGILSCLKIIAITLKKRKIYELSEKLGQLYKSISIDSDYGLHIRSQLVLLKTLEQYFFVLNGILISVYNFSTPLIMLYNGISGEMPFVLPYQVLLPFEIESWTVWTVVYIHLVITGFICVLYFTTTDVLYCVLTTHICANFIVISSKVEKLNKDNVADSLRDIIRYHQYILGLSEDLEDIFTAPNLFNVLVGSIEICALGFNLAMGDVKQVPGCILFLVSVLMQILMMSVFGENIITESTKVGEAAYTCSWYDMDENTKKIILTLMIRSRKPVRLTAYKFSVISYSSFCKILSTSWSYFTILRTIYTPPLN